MIVRISRWGNSLAVRIPKGLLDGAQLQEGDEVEMQSEEGTIVIVARKGVPSLQELVARITAENTHAEQAPLGVGSELW